MLHHDGGAAAVVDAEGRVAVTAHRRVHEHGRRVIRPVLGEKSPVRVRGHDQEPVDPTLERADGRRRLPGRAVHPGEQQMQPAPPRRLIDAADDFREEFAVEVREQHADRVREAGAERARSAVRHVAQPLRDAENALARSVRDIAVAVDHP